LGLNIWRYFIGSRHRKTTVKTNQWVILIKVGLGGYREAVESYQR